VSVRHWLLTNIQDDAGHFRWSVNLEAISNHLDDILGFPHFETTFHGNCLFIGGCSSPMIT